jgi:hypothetical protein
MYSSISINDENFKKKLMKTYYENGFAVINDVFTNEECDNWIDSILDNFEKLGTGFDKNDVENTWNIYNLPPQTRDGLFQSLVTNFKEIYEIRFHENVKFIFKTIYSELRGKKINKFICSQDGINMRPNIETSKNSKDWSHCDQTIRNDIYKCVQGQAVLTNTTACFVCSPKSHLIFDDILDELKIPEDDTSNWLKFKDEQKDIIKKMVIDSGGEWQIPILSKKGSFIIWSSTLIHAARLQTKKEPKSKKDKYLGWRCVIYVCYRPLSEFTKREIEKREEYFDENRTTNHWGKLFGKTPGGRYLYLKKRHPNIEDMIKNPKLVYDKIDKPKIKSFVIDALDK